MKPENLLRVLLFSLSAMGMEAVAGQRTAGYAITGITKGDIGWMVIRQVDLGTGREIKTLYAPDNKVNLFDAATGKRLEEIDYSITALKGTLVNRNGISSTEVQYADGMTKETVTAPTETLVAAAAFDEKSNRLFFTPMHGNDLRYIDLNQGSSTFYYVRNAPLRGFAPSDGEADVITRMCIGADGAGYALTNDGNHLIHFTTSGRITMSDLGALHDAKSNGDVSIHDMPASWGGDMVADVFGNLYVMSMQGNVFKVNTLNMEAEFIATIKNLPSGYTVNGAAINDEGKLIISSALKADQYYSVDMESWEAKILPAAGEVFNASDLASSHLAFENLLANKALTDERITLYPNPVINRTFTLSFQGARPVQYHLFLTTAAGKAVFEKVVILDQKIPAHVILPSSLAGGAYLVQVFDPSGKTVYNGKIVVL